MTLKFKTVKMNGLARIPIELLFWVMALTLLGTADPAGPQHGAHFTFCPLANMGLNWCPGCGLGRAITQVLHGHVRESLHFHWLGAPAVGVIVYRVVTLSAYEWRLLKDIKI